MSMSGYAAYGQVHRQNLKGRSLEGEAFMKAVRLLLQAQQNPANNRLLCEALDYTRKLWSIVEADVQSPSNFLDSKIKANLLSLAQYVERTCLDSIRLSHRQSLNSLIAVNREIARGLMG